ncbi:MAG: topoisomerase [Solirubrobacterales bacterium]|jgi:DNA topoisomerase-1|nr:topoisomerase [Solirubrobacterales bacterium]
MPRLRRVDCSGPGIARVKRGRGFSYLGENGEPIEDSDVLARIGALAIPPAWRDVWICVHPMGHIQATGVDDRGRKQYRYHDRWRERRDAEKFESMIAFARSLPSLRRGVARDLARPDLDRRRALALAVRLLDIGFFRIGSEDYAQTNESYGLATILKEHVTIDGDAVVFDYPAKSGQRRVQSIADPDVLDLVAALKRRRGGGRELLAYRAENGRWRDVKSDEINAYLKELTGGEHSAKDFRTWNATVLAAVALATNGREAASRTARKRAVTAAVKEVAFYLGNTPAVCRASYIDPRVIDRYEGGLTIAERLADLAEPGDEDTPSDLEVPRRVEGAVLDLIAGDEDAPGVEELEAA